MEEAEAAAATAREGKRPRDGDATVPEALKRMRGVAARDPQYPYRPIADALKEEALGVKVCCLFAVVFQIGLARKSLGTDFFVTLRIADESCKPGISATFFAKDPALLPSVKSTGDVISLHDVVVKRYQELFVTFDKKVSSFALFESQVSAECNSYQASLNYRSSKHDKECLTQMRAWLIQGMKDLGTKDLELPLCGLKSDSTFDLVCKVLHVLEVNGKLILYVWDGTDTPAAKFQAISDAEAVAGTPLSREVLCTMPCVGSVLRIFSDSVLKQVSYMQKGIYWARFFNITCKQEFGIWKGIFLESSGVRLLSHEDGSVVDRLKMYNSRNANRVHCRPMASFPSNVTVLSNEYEKEGYSTLRESLTHPEVTHKVKTLVRVVAAVELHSLSNIEHSLRLTLEDPTARIDAYVHKNGLVNFFGGGSLKEEVVIKKMNRLLGVPEAGDSEEVAPLTYNPPWIWCVLVSYYQEKNNPWGSRGQRVPNPRHKDQRLSRDAARTCRNKLANESNRCVVFCMCW